MRALALGGRVGIESQPRNKYSLGTRARAFSGLLPHSWPCGSSRTLSSTAAATEDLMSASWGPRASCQPAQPWPGPQTCFNLPIIKPQPWTTSCSLMGRLRPCLREDHPKTFCAREWNKDQMQGLPVSGGEYPALKSTAGGPSRRLGSKACSVGPSKEHRARSSTQCQAFPPGTMGSGQTGPATCLLTLGRMLFSVGSARSPQAVARQAVRVVSP